MSYPGFLVNVSRACLFAVCIDCRIDVFRYSACTCPNEDHPGPDLSSPKGRGAPEIDILEAQKNKEGPGGRVTQSAQIAPFSASYYFPNSSTDIPIADPTITKLNSYRYVRACAVIVALLIVYFVIVVPECE